MRSSVILFAALLLIAAAGCFGRGGSDVEEEYADGGLDPAASSSEEILRFLHETGRSDEARFVPAERDPFAPIRTAAAAPTPPPARLVVKRRTPAPAPALRLVGILQGKESATARIGSGAYHTGDRVGNYEIIAIGEDHIILERDGTRHTVEVGRTLPGPGEGGIGS